MFRMSYLGDRSVVASCLRRNLFCLFVFFSSTKQRIENRIKSNCADCYFYLYIEIRLVPQGVSLYHSTGRARRTSPCDVIIVSRICVKFVVLRGKIAFKITSLRDVGRSGSFGAFTFTLLYHV